MEKKLYRSRNHRIIAGVMGGFGEYFDIDPLVFRLLYAALTLFTLGMPGILLYLVAIFIIPLEPKA